MTLQRFIFLSMTRSAAHRKRARHVVHRRISSKPELLCYSRYAPALQIFSMSFADGLALPPSTASR